jgi:hypothetical protein
MTESQGGILFCPAGGILALAGDGARLTAHFGLRAPALIRKYAKYAGETVAQGLGEESETPHLRERSGAERADPVDRRSDFCQLACDTD